MVIISTSRGRALDDTGKQTTYNNGNQSSQSPFAWSGRFINLSSDAVLWSEYYIGEVLETLVEAEGAGDASKYSYLHENDQLSKLKKSQSYDICPASK